MSKTQSSQNPPPADQAATTQNQGDQTPNQNGQDPAASQGTSQSPPDENPPPASEPAATISLTPDQLQQIIANATAAGIAHANAQAEQTKAAAVVAEPEKLMDTQALAVEAVPSTGSTFPYGNLDEDEEFDLSKLIPGLKAFPDGKIIIVLQTYSKDAAGDESETKKLRRAQFIDVADYIHNTKKDPETGDTLWDQMQIRYTTVHDPRIKA